ncbi:MAG TPA: lipopolysaccharide biosynthesis protein [Candidatus Ventrimonas merdavium]|nr:lipopolysaccharide biosynthesis protein [Candidatus Ventrimonas merdavium]
MDRWTAALIRTRANREQSNMLWNMAGSFCYAFSSMVLSFLVMRLAGEAQGGIFAFGFSTVGQQMFLLAYFGIRPFQITDGAGEYQFGDYLHHRKLTCLAAVGLGLGYLAVSRYSLEKAAILFLLIGYKVLDGFADVYESEFQRQGRLYLTGKSNTFRTILSVGVFLVTLTAGRDLAAACIAAVLAQGAGVWLFDVTVLRCLPGVMYERRPGSVQALTASTVLLFVSVFLDFYVFSAAKYAIDAHMYDAASGYFNVIFMPTSVINLAAGFVIRPFLTSLTYLWNERRFSEFSGKLLRITAVIGGLSVLAVGATALLGRPVLAVLEWLLGPVYAGKLTAYSGSFTLIVLGGGFYAVLNLYYYALVIMRRQRTIFGIYLVMAALAFWLAPAMVISRGIPGAARAYLILMALMAAAFVGFAWGDYAKEKRRRA